MSVRNCSGRSARAFSLLALVIVVALAVLIHLYANISPVTGRRISGTVSLNVGLASAIRDSIHGGRQHNRSEIGAYAGRTASSADREPHCYGWHGLGEAKKDVGLLVVVKTATWNVRKRLRLREHWAQECLEGKLRFPRRATLPGGDRVQCVFLVGLPKPWTAAEEEKLLQKLGDERQYTVVAPMVDDYGTMTSKTMWALQWSLRTYCFRHLLFVDDDAYVFFSRLLPYLSEIVPSRQTGLYLGHSHWKFEVYHCNAPPRPKDKNCVDPDVYPRKHFFPFASGFSYLLSRDAAEKAVQMALVHVSRSLTLPGNTEDAMVGHVLHEANISLRNHAGFVHWHSLEERCPVMDKGQIPVLVVGNAADFVLDQLAKNEKQSLPLCTGL